MEKREFARRIYEMRKQKGISARDMSLTLGQSQNYINSVEKGIYYPSMQVFFEICEYFGITPKAFFDEETNSPVQMSALMEAAHQMDEEELTLMAGLAKKLTKEYE